MNILALVGQIKDGLSYFLVIPLVFIVGLFFSISLNWLQLKHFKTAFNCILNHNTKSQSSGFSSFAALSAVLGGNLGTGNIAGVAVALSVGGPGALFWMWLMAILGSVIKFVGAYLGVIYRRETNIPGANFIGGPMYYLEDGLNLKFLAKVYAWCMIISAFLVGNLVQINSLSLPLEILPLNIPPLGFGVMVALLVGWIIFSKAKVFIRFVTMVVPFMAVVYLGACTYILLVNYSELPKAIYLIITSAFDVKSILSGGAAYTVAQAVKSGFDRGLFATDAGVGLAAILHSEVEIDRAKLKEGALLQGLVSIIAPIIVLFICTVTGLVLIVTGAWSDPCLQSTNLCIKAFNLGIKDGVGSILVTVTLILFAVTTILTWLHCARRAIDYLVGSSSKKWAVVMQVLFLLVIPLGTVANVQFSWIMADIFLNLLLVINLYGLFRLFSRHKEEIKEMVIKL